jgi:hypothetical protein
MYIGLLQLCRSVAIQMAHSCSAETQLVYCSPVGANPSQLYANYLLIPVVLIWMQKLNKLWA